MNIASAQFELLKSMGLNSFGTSPYDGSPEVMIMANVKAVPTLNQFKQPVIELVNESNPKERLTVQLRRGVPLDKASYDFKQLTAQEDRDGVSSTGKPWKLTKGVTKKTFAF